MRSVKFALLGSLGLLVGGIASQPAFASTAQADLDVLARVEPACTLTTTPVDFGTVDPTQNIEFQAAGAIDVTCTAGVRWEALASAGAYAVTVGGATVRAMSGQNSPTPALLKYQLYTDSARTNLWEGGISSFTGTGTGSAQNQIVYGSIPSGQTTVPVDSYKDTVVVSVEY